jgi:hypothetical protein
MKTNIKLVRLMLATSVGSLLWAGCAQPRYMASQIDPGAIQASPIDQIEQRPDTHPELRAAIWRETYQNFQPAFYGQSRVIETSNVRMPDADTTTADSTSLLEYNPEVVNVALSGDAPGIIVVQAPGSVIVEAAGAEVPPVRERVVVRERMNWRDRLMQNKTLVDQTEP